jgi:hypothetical protein
VRFYTGVGSRMTPAAWLVWMTQWALVWQVKGWTLRSGHAPGADYAFECGAGTDAEIYLPWPSFERNVGISARTVKARPSDRAWEIAREHHPHWERLSKGARLLHARNSHEVLGADCESPSAMLVCWTPAGHGGGGTGQAIRVARAYGVPVFDLGKPWALAAATGFMLEYAA